MGLQDFSGDLHIVQHIYIAAYVLGNFVGNYFTTLDFASPVKKPRPNIICKIKKNEKKKKKNNECKKGETQRLRIIFLAYIASPDTE